MRARVLAVLLTLVATAAAGQAPPGITMGVRTDAEPFVSAGPDGRYRGFLVDLCRGAVAAAGYDIAAEVPIAARDRMTRLDDPAQPIDLLCDPTTLTMARARERDFSQIVFVANSTFLRRTSLRAIPAAAAPAGCDTGDADEVLLAGWVDGTTAEATMAAALEERRVPLGQRQRLCPVAFDGHDAGIAELCAPDGRLSLYFGDGDILSAQLDRLVAAGQACPVAFETGFFRFEPYALMLGDRLPGFRQQFARGIYAFFGGGAAEASFAEHFPGRTMSPPLEMLFRLYRIPGSAPTAAD